MTDSNLRAGSRQWRGELVGFVEQWRDSNPIDQPLSPLQDWQRRITGGVLIQFFEFLEEKKAEIAYPQLEDHPLPERLCLLISDAAGLQAAQDLVDTTSDQVFCLLKEEWRAFLEAPDTDDDESFVHHYQFWSVWHQNVEPSWDVPTLDPELAYWVHEEGFALADGAGRGAQHLWRWNGTDLELVEETMTSWAS